MAKRWTEAEENLFRSELNNLYVNENKSIGEISLILKLSESSVYDRLVRLNIPTNRSAKAGYNKQRRDIKIPNLYSENLAEFFGILIGDGHISHYQTVVTLGTKERSYVNYVAKLMNRIFQVPAHISVRKNGYTDVYIGSVFLTTWLRQEGLVSNKVKSQVRVPIWMFSNDTYMKRFIRGFFDTDGSVYKLRYGIQISFCNYSVPILKALQQMLLKLGYTPSSIGSKNLYLTKKLELQRFFKEIQPKNTKHLERYKKFCVGSPVGSGSGL